MKVVILCGGKGTRIRDVSGDLPKPMVTIGNRPIIEHIMEIYSQHGHREFVLCLGYLGWQIREHFLNYRFAVADLEVHLSSGDVTTFDDTCTTPPWSVVLAGTGLENQTGSRIAQIQRYTQGERFFATYGDGVGDVDIDALLAFHGSHNRLATVTSVRPPSRFGELVLDGDVVTRFDEKPQIHGGHINGGFFVFEPGVFDYLDTSPDCTLEGEPLRRLAADGELMTYTHSGFWMPMDTAREHSLLNSMWSAGDAPWTRVGSPVR